MISSTASDPRVQRIDMAVRTDPPASGDRPGNSYQWRRPGSSGATLVGVRLPMS